MMSPPRRMSKAGSYKTYRLRQAQPDILLIRNFSSHLFEIQL
jgi:hypothetical protein